MAKGVVKQDNIVERKESAVPVEPSVRQFNVYGITPPSEFALYGTGSKALYDLEIQRVANELRQEVFYSNEIGQVQSLSVENEVNNTKKARKCNGVAILVFITSVLILSLYVIGKYIASPISSMASLFFITDKAGLGVIFDLINVFLKGSEIKVIAITMQIAVSAVALMSIVILLSSIFIMARPGVGKAMKTALFINFVFTVVIAVMVLIDKGTLSIGYYVLFGLTFLSMVCGIFSKGNKKKVKE